MLQFKDFVPRQLSPPGFFKPEEHEAFDAAVKEANAWLQENAERVQLINLETIVLPNIHSPWEEGSTDASLGTSAESASRWHQVLRCWYQLK